jgi:hypothetical protein
MDRPTDELVQRLLAALAAGADDDAARLVEQARGEAEAEVKDVIKGAFKAMLLRRAVDHLEGRPAAPPAPAGVEQPAASEAVPGPGLKGPADPAPAPRVNTAAPPGRPLCYMYAITRGSWGVPPPDLPAIDRRSHLRTVSVDDLQAIVSDVGADEFSPVALEDRLKDLQWVEEKVRAHDAAVKALSARGTVIPCRFCTVLSGEGEAAATLTRHHDAVVRTLESIDGKTEWGVKLMADTRASAAPGPGVEPTGDAGRAYLMQKKQSGRRREDVLRAAAEAAEACHRELFELAADAAVLPTRDRGGSARGWHLAMNAAYLVADADAPAFHARVAELARRYRPQNLRLDLTGPWPPYNFSTLELSEAGKA